MFVNPWTLALFLAPGAPALHRSSRMLIGLLDALFVITGIALLTAPPATLRRVLPRVFTLAISLLLSVLLIEGILRVLTPESVFHPNLALYPYRNYALRVNLLGVSRTGRYTTNKWGMRGDPIPRNWSELTTVLTIGGSTTQCYYLSDDKTWPARLQQVLRRVDPKVMVQNAGLDGHSTRGHLLMMKEVVPVVKPKILVMLVGMNDLSYSIDEQHLLLGNPNEMTGLGYYVFSHSRIVQLIYKWHQILVNRAPIVEGNPDAKPTGHPRKPLLHPTPLPENIETILPSLREFEANLGEIIRLAGREGVKLVILTQPLLFDDTSEWDRIEWSAYWLQGQKYAISAATLWKMQKIFNDRLLRICRDRRVACFDLAAAIPHEQTYFYDSVHFNEAGSVRVAERLSDFLVKNGILAEIEGGSPEGRKTR